MSLKLPSIEKHYEILELLFNTIPYVFWKDKNGKYQGGNLNQARNLGFSSPKEFLGKTIFEILKDQKAAKAIDELDNKVMDEDITVTQEEKIITSNEEKVYLSQKSPIHDDEGEVIGMLGFAMDITEIKRQEELAKKERDRLIDLAAQVAHDIRSPTSALQMLENSCQELLPERERIALREAIARILDIANNLLNQYKPKNLKKSSLVDGRQAMLVSAAVLQLISEKRMQYQNLSIEFSHKFTQEGNFAFIKIDPADFNRMISNIINNAVDALDEKSGKIILRIEANKERVKIIIIDNGSGMPSELVKKITDNIIFTEGKKQGHGIGLSQVREVLQLNQGKFEVESKPGKGTKVILTFPRLAAPNWIAEKINLGMQDIVIILDDDSSIHFAWDKRFEPILQQAPDIKMQHFKQGQVALDYINKLSDKERTKVFLLTDYELLKQELNGLDVVARCDVKRSVLVTSHYTNKVILDRAISIGTKVLPKQLASEIPIKIDEKFTYVATQKEESNIPKKVDLVIIDDDERFTKSLMDYVFFDRAVACYHDPRKFLKEVAQYPKDTTICIDNNFGGGAGMKGLDVAEKLHALGYTRLFLLSGDAFKKEEVPAYLIAILKTDLEGIKKI
jgi:PAS domain S-box-containing protein